MAGLAQTILKEKYLIKQSAIHLLIKTRSLKQCRFGDELEDIYILNVNLNYNQSASLPHDEAFKQNLIIRTKDNKLQNLFF